MVASGSVKDDHPQAREDDDPLRPARTSSSGGGSGGAFPPRVGHPRQHAPSVDREFKPRRLLSPRFDHVEGCACAGAHFDISSISGSHTT
jgi:hypothetical protein